VLAAVLADDHLIVSKSLSTYQEVFESFEEEQEEVEAEIERILFLCRPTRKFGIQSF
jgi:hypothetical protein